MVEGEGGKECWEGIGRESGMMLVGMEMGWEGVCGEKYVFGIRVRLGNGRIVRMKKGRGKCVMEVMKVYEKEDMVCLE